MPARRSRGRVGARRDRESREEETLARRRRTNRDIDGAGDVSFHQHQVESHVSAPTSVPFGTQKIACWEDCVDISSLKLHTPAP